MHAVWVGLVAVGCGRIDFEPIACTADPALVACLAFEGDARDGSTHHNDGILGGGVDFVPGVHGLAARFTPVSSLFLPEASSLDVGAVTVEAQVRVDVSSTLRIGLLDNPHQYGVFVMPGGLLRCAIGSTMNFLATTTAAIPLGTWTHVACTADDSEVVAWIDGVRAATLPYTPPVSNVGIMGTRIGGNNPDAGDPADEGLVGALDDLRIWSRARTAAELCADAGGCF